MWEDIEEYKFLYMKAYKNSIYLFLKISKTREIKALPTFAYEGSASHKN